MTDWQDRAACSSDPPDYDTFFPQPDDVLTIRRAKAVCETCPVQAECLEDAFGWPEMMDYGIRGGLTEQERQVIRADLPPPDPGTPPHPGHGSAAGYTYEVRHLGRTCEACRHAEARRQEALIASKGPLDADDPRHGRRRGYRLGCRCEMCCQAEASYKVYVSERRRMDAS